MEKLRDYLNERFKGELEYCKMFREEPTFETGLHGLVGVKIGCRDGGIDWLQFHKRV
ncbi:MAG: hypothetical protein ACUVQY_05795 [Thermoproteota archaeon]